MISTAPVLTRAEGAERLRRRIETRTMRCGVIGLGFVGSILADALRSAGFEVTAHDKSPEAVDAFRSRRCDTPASTDPRSLAESDALVVAVRLTARPNGAWDQPLRSVTSLIERLPRAPRLIVLATTVPVGATRAFATTLSDRETTFVVHAPERLRVGDDAGTAREIPHVVGGVDHTSTELGRAFLEAYCDEVVVVSKPEVSELGKLLENSFRAVGIALVSELTKIAHATDTSAAEVAAAAATKPFGYFPFHPGPGVGGHCLGNDLELLQLSASSTGVSSPLLAAAGEVLGQMPEVAVERVEHLLGRRGTQLGGARVLLVGTGFKVGSSEQHGTSAGPVTSRLRERGAVVSYYDSANESFSVDGVAVPRVELDAITAGAFDVAIVLAGDACLAAERLVRAAALVVDAGGGKVLPGDPRGMVPL